MSGSLDAHLATGVTTVCRCWRIRRSDGVTLGFTDHDGELQFDGVTFRAETGLTAQAAEHGTGLAVDTAAALGVLSDAAIRSEDLSCGRYDGADVTLWRVNWRDVGQRKIVFRGSIGEIEISGGRFRAELRGVADALNHVRGSVFQPTCNADLGDAACGVNLSDPAFATGATVLDAAQDAAFRVAPDGAYPRDWFLRGQVRVDSGAAVGLSAFIKQDRLEGGERVIALWEPLCAPLVAGDRLRLIAGCDKRLETCRDKFANLINFRGFPHIPGEDWSLAYPRSSDRNAGGSLQ